MNTADVREKFLAFFESRDHQRVASSSLVPGNDKTLLFTNAGMVPFKEVFQGLETLKFNRAVSSQRCVRAGGKHNDLENVGYTTRHHTFFEMLGNFSFGAYFKEQAIEYAWEFLTKEIGLQQDKLWVTVFEEDDEAADIWLNKIGIDPKKLARIGAKDNFWSMGDIGPCGPCSEIFYDHGPEVSGGPPGTPEEDGDRYVEIWNLVFMQYDRNASGKMTPLPKPSVDTGMGLERLAAILQGAHSNYSIDLFQSLIEAAARETGCTDMDNVSLKVIADHIRSCSFLIVDGVLPSNEGRGYVLRRIIRRALRHGHKLGQEKPFFYRLVKDLVRQMGEAYPELTKNAGQVEKVLKNEELRFAETLDKGMAILLDVIETTNATVLDGNTVFKLYDTYGFPYDLTADVAREHNMTIDLDQFERDMQAQRERARASSQFKQLNESDIDTSTKTTFTGYQNISDQGCVLALYLRDDGNKDESVDSLSEGDQGVLVVNSTPFYAESGGQIGDKGIIHSATGQFEVTDTQKQADTWLHIGCVKQGKLATEQAVKLDIDSDRRLAIVLNHSATHLMHAALREVLGEHVQQKGSLVNEERLRFDFSHFELVTRDQLTSIESIVNKQIRTNSDAVIKEMSMQQAKDSGAVALFGEKYGDNVRVVNIGFSTELCGGNHVNRAGDIGVFKIVSEGGVAAGVRRIEAITGQLAFQAFSEQANTIQKIAGMLHTNDGKVKEKVASLLAETKAQDKEISRLKSKLAAKDGGSLADQAVEIGGIKVLAASLEGADPKTLRDTVDQLKQKLGRAAIVLAAVNGDKISLVAGVTKKETEILKAGELVNMVASQIGGKGGGRPDMAQAGGDNPDKLPAALNSVQNWVSEKIK